MWLVAVTAAHAPVVHLALEEGTVHVDLVELLPVGVVSAASKELRTVAVQEGLACAIFGGQGGPAGVAGSACLDLGARIGVLQIQDEAIPPGSRPPFPAGPGPRDVRLSGAMTGLAGHVDLAPGCLVGVGR